jgi:hypothetical protein
MLGDQSFGAVRVIDNLIHLKQPVGVVIIHVGLNPDVVIDRCRRVAMCYIIGNDLTRKIIPADRCVLPSLIIITLRLNKMSIYIKWSWGWAVVGLFSIVVSHSCTEGAASARAGRRIFKTMVVGGHISHRRCSRGMSVARPIVNARKAAYANMVACGAGRGCFLPGALLIGVKYYPCAQK